MKRSLVVVGLLAGALLVSLRMEALSRTEDVGKMIKTASEMLLSPSPREAQIQSALIQLLDAALLTLPRSEHFADASSNLQAGRTEFKDHSMLSKKGYEHLAIAYRALNSGKSFQFPDVHSMEEVKASIQGRIAASIAGLNKGQGELTSRLLLECVIMVVTPISK